MKRLYEVKTRRYKSYYVMAGGYDEAESKAERVIVDEGDGCSVLEADGSLRNGPCMDVVVEIRCLSDKLIV